MPSFEKNKTNNADSKSNNKASALIRDKSRAIKAERKARLDRAKALGAGTRVIREIKSEYSRNKSGIYDVSTSSSEVKNLEDQDSTIQDNSIDNAYETGSGDGETMDVVVCNSETGISEIVTFFIARSE